MSMDLYYAWQQELKTGDVLLWSSSSVIGWLIRKFTGAPVNHAGLVVRLAEFGALKDRRFTLEALERGIVLRLLSKRLQKHKGQAWWYKLQPEFENKRERVAEWAFLNIGMKYDYGSLFRQAIMRVSVDAKKFFCSEYVWFALHFADIVPFREIAPQPHEIPELGVFQKGIKIYDSKIQGRVV